jgi:hypothetical protein
VSGPTESRFIRRHQHPRSLRRRIGDPSRGPCERHVASGTKGEISCGWLQATRNPFFCFEQALIALSFSQKFLAFRSRFIFSSCLNFSGDRLIQFIDGPMRYWFPAHTGFLAVADQNPSFTGCPTFIRQLTKLMPKRKICLSDRTAKGYARICVGGWRRAEGEGEIAAEELSDA